MVILHASDLHFGKKHYAQAAEAFLGELAETEYDLLVLSGDFTQRAKLPEYEAARAFLDALPDRPLVVTPGNHDIPLYRVFERAFQPVRNYTRFISPDLDSAITLPRATVVSLDSTSPYRTIVNGRLSAAQLRFAQNAFAKAPDEHARILVMHHALAPAPDWERDSVMRAANGLAREFVAMGVELVLAGHLHRAFITTTADAGPTTPVDPFAWVIHSGTTTSIRGRGRERGCCTFNRIEIGEEHLLIHPYMYSSERAGFSAIREVRLPRRGRQFRAMNRE